MPILLKKTVAVMDGICNIEEAENLLEWLLEHPNGKINLKNCEHMHTSILQVIMASGASISAAPENDIIARTLYASGIAAI